MKKIVLLLSIPFLFLFACKSDTKAEKDVDLAQETIKEAIAYASFGAEITDENVLNKTQMIETYKNLII